MTPSIKSKLRKKKKLMHNGRIEEANQLAKRIGMEITKANAIRLRTLDSRGCSKEFWAAVSRIKNKGQNETIADKVDAMVLNNHYATISSDSNYWKPCQKSSAAL